MGFNRANIERDSDGGFSGTADHKNTHTHTDVTQTQTHAHTHTHRTHNTVTHCKFNSFCCLLTTSVSSRIPTLSAWTKERGRKEGRWCEGPRWRREVPEGGLRGRKEGRREGGK